MTPSRAKSNAPLKREETYTLLLLTGAVAAVAAWLGWTFGRAHADEGTVKGMVVAATPEEPVPTYHGTLVD